MVLAIGITCARQELHCAGQHQVGDRLPLPVDRSRIPQITPRPGLRAPDQPHVHLRCPALASNLISSALPLTYATGGPLAPATFNTCSTYRFSALSYR